MEFFGFEYQTHVSTRYGIVDEQRNDLVAYQCVIRVVESSKRLPYNRNYSYIFYDAHTAHIIGVEIVWEFLVYSSFGKFSIFRSYYQAYPALWWSLWDDTHTDTFLCEGFKNTSIYAHFAQESATFHHDKGIVFNYWNRFDTFLLVFSVNECAGVFTVESVFDTQRNAFFNEWDNSFGVEYRSSKVSQFIGFFVRKMAYNFGFGY